MNRKLSLDELFAFAMTLSDEGRRLISEAYRSAFTVRQKADKSAVTEIDERVEKALRLAVEERYSGHNILGEEFGVKDCNSDYKWIFDPIDGTASFLIGRPLFCQLIALQYEQEMLFGVVDQAITQERWWGIKGRGAFYNGSPIKTRACSTVSEAVLCTTSEEYFSGKEHRAFQVVAAQAQHRIYGGDAYNYALLAQGTVDLVVEAGLKPYDYAALVPLVQEAGGIITDWNGQTLDGCSVSTVLACGDPNLHAAMVTLLQENL